MRRLGSVLEFALVAAFGVTLTAQATGSPVQPRSGQEPAPSIEQVEAAIAGAEARAIEVNGRR
jgi:hypothetical protein